MWRRNFISSSFGTVSFTLRLFIDKVDERSLIGFLVGDCFRTFFLLDIRFILFYEVIMEYTDFLISLTQLGDFILTEFLLPFGYISVVNFWYEVHLDSGDHIWLDSFSQCVILWLFDMTWSWSLSLGSSWKSTINRLRSSCSWTRGARTTWWG